jgi:hypothetical protein
VPIDDAPVRERSALIWINLPGEPPDPATALLDFRQIVTVALDVSAVLDESVVRG